MTRFGNLARLGLLTLAATPAVARAKNSERAPSHSVIVFVGADDRGAETSALKLGTLVEDALARNERVQLTPLAEAAGEKVPGDVRGAMRSADDDLANGKKLFAEGKLDDAETALKSAIKGYESAAAALEKPDPYAEANAYLGAVYQLKKKDDDAKDAVAEALAVKPSYKPDGKLDAGVFGDLYRSVKREVGEGHRGSASLFSTPSGGRVLIDGEVRGYTPLTVDRLPVGRHLIRMERPGYQSFGQVAEITSTDEVAVKGHFNATKDFADVEDAVGQALKEVDSSSAGPAAFKLLGHFKVDRGVFANVRTSGDNLTLDLSLVDVHAHKRLAHRRNSFEGEDPKTMEREVSKLVAGLLADADEGPKVTASKGKDPLDSVSGMEDWDDDKGSAKRGGGDDEDDSRKKKKKSSDDE